MKRYRVVFVVEAKAEALAAAEYIAREAPLAAAEWYEGLERAIDDLAVLPNRCAMAPEAEFLGVPIRHCLYKSHRILFDVIEKTRTVRILHVRHGKQRALGEPADED